MQDDKSGEITLNQLISKGVYVKFHKITKITYPKSSPSLLNNQPAHPSTTQTFLIDYVHTYVH